MTIAIDDPTLEDCLAAMARRTGETVPELAAGILTETCFGLDAVLRDAREAASAGSPDSASSDD